MGLKIIPNKCVQAFDCIKPLCRKLRRVLFSLTNDGERWILQPRLIHKNCTALFINASGDAIAGLETDS